MEMADSFNLLMLWNVFSSVFFQLVFFGTAVYYIVRKQSVEGFLLAGGSFIHILTSIFYSLVLPILVRNSGTSIYSNSFLMPVVSVINIIGSVLFAIGFIILVINYISLFERVEAKQNF